MSEVESPRWGTATKAFVALAILLAVGVLGLRFLDVIPLLFLALVLSFVILPLVQFLHYRLKAPWGLAANLVMLLVVAALAALSTAAGFAIVQQIQALFTIVQSFLLDLPAQLESISQQTIAFGRWTLDLSQFDLAPLGDQMIASLQPLLGSASALITSIATGAVSSLARVVFVLAITYFLIFDYRKVREALLNISVPGYEEDVRRLRLALLRIWHAFVRGQLLIVLFTGLLTWALMTVLGVRFGLGLGVLGGIAKFAPIVGPFTAGAIAGLVALFQPGNWFHLTPLGHALVVILSVVVLDQAIDYLLVPRIMGTSLNLHPVAVLIGLLVGASLAGVIGLLFASPMLASFILLARYTYRKMFDLPPWDPPIDSLGERRRTSAVISLWTRWKKRRAKRVSSEEALFQGGEDTATD